MPSIQNLKSTRACLLIGWMIIFLFQATLSPGDVSLIDLYPVLKFAPDTVDISIRENLSLDVLTHGWSKLEKAHADQPYLWAVGDYSILKPVFLIPGDRILRVSCQAFNHPRQKRQTIGIEANGTPVGEITLEASEGWKSHDVILPGEVLRIGENEIVFRYEWHGMPFELHPGARDRRSLSVCFSQISFYPVLNRGGGLREINQRVPSLTVQDDILIQQGASRWSLFLRPLDGTRFESQVSALFAGNLQEMTPRVEILLQVEGASAPVSLEVFSRREMDDSAERVISLDLSQYAGKLVELILTSTADEVYWKSPSIVGMNESQLFAELEENSLWPLRNTSPVEFEVEHPPVFIYLMDTLRQDMVERSLGENSVMPNLDILMAQSATFDQAYASNPWTKNSVAALFCGRYPSALRITGPTAPLPLKVGTLADYFSEAGYQTAAFSTNGYVSHEFQMSQGFQTFVYLQEINDSEHIHQKADALNEAFFRFMSERDNASPLFCYLHSTDAHSPYTPLDSTLEALGIQLSGSISGQVQTFHDWRNFNLLLPPEELAELRSLYIAEIHENDRALGEWLDELQRLGLYEDAVIIITSDHGEEFLEHGNLEHSKTLYPEVLHVPLVVKFPGGQFAGQRVSAPVQLIDLLPTLLDVIHVEKPDSLAGISLLDILASPPLQESIKQHRVLFSEMSLPDMRRVAVQTGEYLAIANLDLQDSHNIPMRAEELYRISQDAVAAECIALEEPVMAGYLTQLARFIQLKAQRQGAEVDAPDQIDFALDPETEIRLRALGYIR